MAIPWGRDGMGWEEKRRDGMGWVEKGFSYPHSTSPAPPPLPSASIISPGLADPRHLAGNVSRYCQPSRLTLR